MSFSARFFILPFLPLLLFLLFVVPVSAQTNQYANPNTNPDVPKNLHTWTQSVMLEVVSAMTCQLTGIDPISKNHKCLGIDSKTGQIGFVDQGGGAIGMMGGLIAATYTPPLHTGDYFDYLAQNFGVVKKAYAQGVGFTGLKPLAGTWTVFRNIVYLLFVIVFVVIGFAVMLRIKIDPRTVMTIENQIPKIIIGIVLVTFSFPIAGLLIDFMYVVIYVIINIMSQADPKIAADAANLVSSTHPLSAAGVIGGSGPLGTGGIFGLASSGASGASEFFRPLGEHPIGKMISMFALAAFGFIGGGAITSALSGALSFIPGAGLAAGFITKTLGTTLFSGILSGIFAAYGASNAPGIAMFVGFWLVFLILTIALLWALFRLWFQLLVAYVYILLDVVLAPFWIIAGVLPGSPVGFGAWFREILANLSAFPTVIGMFLLGRVFIDTFGPTQSSGQFVPPLIGNPASINAIGSLIGIGIILMTPQVVSMMRDLFKPPPFKYSAAIGQAVGIAPGIVGGTAHALFSPYGALSMFTSATREGGTFSTIRGLFGKGGARGVIPQGQPNVPRPAPLGPEQT